MYAVVTEHLKRFVNANWLLKISTEFTSCKSHHICTKYW